MKVCFFFLEGGEKGEECGVWEEEGRVFFWEGGEKGERSVEFGRRRRDGEEGCFFFGRGGGGERERERSTKANST